MYIRFNNNNIWEKKDYGNGVTEFYKRVLTPKTIRDTVFIDVDEDQLSVNDKYTYNDWKIFFGEQRLKDIAANVKEEQFALPLIYYAKYILDLKNMERLRSTKYKFTSLT